MGGVHNLTVIPGNPGNFDAFINTITRYLNAMTDLSNPWDKFNAENVFYIGTYGDNFTIERFWNYITSVLPGLLSFVGVVIAVKLCIKLVKRFSR